MARVLAMTATRVDFPEHVEKIFSWPAQPSIIVRVSGDALPSLNEVPIIPITIKHDPLSVGQLGEVVLWDLLGDDEVVGRLPDPPRFKLNQSMEKLCGNMRHGSRPSF
jgi:hypothetical protein